MGLVSNSTILNQIPVKVVAEKIIGQMIFRIRVDSGLLGSDQSINRYAPIIRRARSAFRAIQRTLSAIPEALSSLNRLMARLRNVASVRGPDWRQMQIRLGGEIINNLVTKQNGKRACIGSIIVDYYGLPTRIVFVRNRNDKKKRVCLALLSTDLEISEEEIIRIYGLHWYIEVFVKMCKSFLRLAKEFHSRSYDTMVAHTTIVCIRYMMLAVENREQKDSKAHGELFYLYCDEVADLDFTQAFMYILDLFTQTLRERLFLSEDMLNQILATFMNKLPKFIHDRLLLNAA